MLGRRRRRWASNKATLGQRLVFKVIFVILVCLKTCLSVSALQTQKAVSAYCQSKGFCQVKRKPNIREKLGSGWVGQAQTRILIFWGESLRFCVFLCCFHVSKKKLIRGWVGVVWSIRVFLGFFDFFQLDKTPKQILPFGFAEQIL